MLGKNAKRDYIHDMDILVKKKPEHIQVSLRFEKSLLEWLDSEARKAGISRQEAVTSILETARKKGARFKEEK